MKYNVLLEGGHSSKDLLPSQMECKMQNIQTEKKPRYAEDILKEKWDHYPMRIFYYDKEKKPDDKKVVLSWEAESIVLENADNKI